MRDKTLGKKNPLGEKIQKKRREVRKSVKKNLSGGFIKKFIAVEVGHFMGRIKLSKEFPGGAREVISGLKIVGRTKERTHEGSSKESRRARIGKLWR